MSRSKDECDRMRARERERTRVRMRMRMQEVDMTEPYVPSLRRRAIVALALLLGFYFVVFGVVSVMLVLPMFTLLSGYVGGRTVLAFAVCWIPAFMLVKGVLSTRPPRFVPPGRELVEQDAPKLFEMLRGLAARAGTHVPSRVYLSPLVEAGVLETGGRFGFGGERVLILGAPLLDMVTVSHLRTILAHELGHFAGGETRLAGVLSRTRALFASTLASVERHPWENGGPTSFALGLQAADAIGGALVRGYARFFFRVTHASSRAQELAADRLAAKLGGRDAAMQALERVSIAAPLYEQYLARDVYFALKSGAMPTDLAHGFTAFEARLMSSDAVKSAVARIRQRPTTIYDSHPALGERLERLSREDEGATCDADTGSAASLVTVDERALSHWRTKATKALFGTALAGVPEMEWSAIPAAIHGPRILEAANDLRRRIQRRFPEAQGLNAILVAMFRAFEEGATNEIVSRVAPRVEHAHPYDRPAVVARAAAEMVITLLEGALVEAGATIDPSPGESCLVFRYEDELVRPAELAVDAMANATARKSLKQWIERLAKSNAPASVRSDGVS